MAGVQGDKARVGAQYLRLLACGVLVASVACDQGSGVVSSGDEELCPPCPPDPAYVVLDGTYQAQVSVTRSWIEGDEIVYDYGWLELIVDQVGPALEYFGVVALAHEEGATLASERKGRWIGGPGASTNWWTLRLDGEIGADANGTIATRVEYWADGVLVEAYADVWTFQNALPIW